MKRRSRKTKKTRRHPRAKVATLSQAELQKDMRARTHLKRERDAREANAADYPDMEAALRGAQSRHDATHAIRGTTNATIFSPTSKGYLKRIGFREKGYYHWPERGELVGDLPSNAEMIHRLVDTGWDPEVAPRVPMQRAAEQPTAPRRNPVPGGSVHGEYLVTTEWRDREGAHFKREHRYDANSPEDARQKERRHNEQRLREGMRADGWMYRIVHVRMLGASGGGREAREAAIPIHNREEFPEILSIHTRPEGVNYSVKVPDTKSRNGYDIVDVLVHSNGMISTRSAIRSRTSSHHATRIVKKYIEADRHRVGSREVRETGRALRKMATTEQMATIKAMRVDDTARTMMAEGVTLTWDQVDDLSGEQIDWLASRLGLGRTTDDRGMVWVPRDPRGGVRDNPVASGGVTETKENPIDTGDSIPWVKIARDPEQYKEAMKSASAIGPIDDSKKVYELLGPALLKEDQEVFLVLLLDVRQNCRGVSEVHRGGRSRVSVSVVDVMRVVVASGAEGFAVIHNHPSGNPSPSDADKDLTKAIERAAKLFDGDLVFVDHVVIGNGEFYSFADKKLHKAKA